MSRIRFSFLKNFIVSLSVGFFIGLGVVFYFMGPRGIREQVCHGYVENAKSLMEARAEKESYLESFMPRSGEVTVAVSTGDAAPSESVAPVAPAPVKHVVKKVSRYRKSSGKGRNAKNSVHAKPKPAGKKSKSSQEARNERDAAAKRS